MCKSNETGANPTPGETWAGDPKPKGNWTGDIAGGYGDPQDKIDPAAEFAGALRVLIDRARFDLPDKTVVDILSVAVQHLSTKG